MRELLRVYSVAIQRRIFWRFLADLFELLGRPQMSHGTVPLRFAQIGASAFESIGMLRNSKLRARSGRLDLMSTAMLSQNFAMCRRSASFRSPEAVIELAPAVTKKLKSLLAGIK